MPTIARRPLGASGLQVSELSLGSWRTYERIPRETGIAVMKTARELGINFLDDARYNDETGTAPLKSGYSEVVFGDLFRASGWKRDEVVVANKLWWEFWPQQRAAAELDESLQRMGLDHLDLVYAERPPKGLTMEEIVHDVTALIDAGKARAWGVLNWKPDLVAEAGVVAAAQGVEPPCAAQLPYSLVHRSMVEDPRMTAALDAAGARVVASFSLMGGALTGKYAVPGASGRLSGDVNNESYQPALKAASELQDFASAHETMPATMAIAFALLDPRVASVLFGATSPQQLTENVKAAALATAMDGDAVAELRRIGLEQ
ncbi:MAG TPA: aldo/keto reductase [Candidatus Dormibacteraeota bacterium]|nr:aldo/keto reductase [Candidatus Dormibacteraeota bacterium]